MSKDENLEKASKRTGLRGRVFSEDTCTGIKEQKGKSGSSLESVPWAPLWGDSAKIRHLLISRPHLSLSLWGATAAALRGYSWLRTDPRQCAGDQMLRQEFRLELLPPQSLVRCVCFLSCNKYLPSQQLAFSCVKGQGLEKKRRANTLKISQPMSLDFPQEISSRQ